MSADLAWTVLAAVVMVVGLIGVVIPVVPGLVVIWAAALAYGFLVGFGWVGGVVMVVLTVALAISLVCGVLLPKRAADGAGVSGWAQVGAVVGAVVGLFSIPFVGLPVGALVGVVAVEYGDKRNWPDAWRSTRAVAKGFGISAAIDFSLGSVMIACWSAWALTVLV